MQVDSYSTLVVAYSGGLDSQVLLHQVRGSLAAGQNLLAVHVNHGLSVNAQQWQAHCEQTCAEWGIPLLIETLALSPTQTNLEAVAREARYAVLARHIKPKTALLTAHHQNDQSETLLLQLLRGAGPRGLAGMPAVKFFGAGSHLRPLLKWTRQELTEYAEKHGLKWCEDESNSNPRFDRNYLRHQVFPVLKKRWPTVAESVARSAEWCAQASECLDDLGQLDLASCAAPNNGLRIDALRQLTRHRLANLLRYWLRQQGFSVPDAKHLSRVMNEVITAKQDAEPVVQWKNIYIRRFRNTLVAMQELSDWDPAQTFQWNLQQTLFIPELGALTASTIQSGGIRLTSIATVEVRFRQGGERFSPAYGNGSRSLKKCFQDWDVPPWLRDRIPLLFSSNELIAVVGYAVARGAQASAGEEGMLVGWAMACPPS